MILSDKEAAQKWCPMVRAESASNSVGPASNRYLTDAETKADNMSPPWARCIGSGCMFWRIAATAGKEIADKEDRAALLLARYPERFEDGGPTPVSFSPNVPKGRRLIYREDVGFCGAAGVPE